MTTTAAYGSETLRSTERPPVLRRIVAGAAPFDGVMGLVCLAAGSPIGDALDVGTAPVEVTGLLFLAAAAAGAWTLRRGLRRMRWIVAANAVFAVWCLAVLATDGPNAIGAALFAVSAVASAATALVEARFARDGRG